MNNILYDIMQKEYIIKVLFNQTNVQTLLLDFI